MVCDGCQEIARGVSLLEQPGDEPAKPQRNLLHGQRRTHAPHASHADPEQPAQRHEGGVIRRQSGRHLRRRIEDQDQHERQASAIATGEQAEDERSHGPEGQSDGNRQRNISVGLLKIPRDGGQAEDHQEVVEGVERPPEEAGSHRRPVVRRRGACGQRRRGVRGGTHCHKCTKRASVPESLTPISAANMDLRVMTTQLLDPALLADPREATEFITNILQASTEYSIIGKGLDGTILLWNEGARRLYGYEPEEVVGKANADILHAPEDVATGKPEEVREAVLRDGSWEGVMERLRKDGRRFMARVVITPRHDAAGTQ